MTLWHASGIEVPRELLAALSGARGAPSGVRVQIVGDPFAALAHLCRATRDERKHPSTPSSARLVIVYPEMLTDAAELCAAADTYAPGVPRWQYGPAANPTLRPIVESDMAMWGRGAGTPAVVVVPEAVRNAEVRARTDVDAGRSSRTMPQLRLAGEGPAPTLDNRPPNADAVEGPKFSGGAPDSASPPVAKSMPLITDEELRMLLGESNDESR